MEACEVCGAHAVQKKTVSDFEYPTPMGLVTIDGASELETCASCGEVFISAPLIDHWNRVILKALLKPRTRYTPHELEFIFSVLSLTQNEIDELSGKDPLDPLFHDSLQQMIEDYLASESDAEPTF